MSSDYKRRTFPGGMPSSDSPCPPPSPPPPSPTRSLSPSYNSPSLPPSPRRTPPPSLNADSPRSSSDPNLSLFPHKIQQRPLSPQNQHIATAAAALIRPTTSHSRRTSLQSVSKMPPIREDRNSIFTDVATAAHRRSKGSFYQYGEDYITSYDRVGLTASPTQRPQSRTSVHSAGGGARSLRRSASVRSAKSFTGKSRRSSRASSKYSAAVARSSLPPESYRGHHSRGSAGTAGTESTYTEGTRDQNRERDLEAGPVSEPESELEKAVMAETRVKRSWWRRWRRFVVILMVVLGLAGLAVGIIFGTRSR